MTEVVLIHYGELALKGGNRAFFEHRLVQNIKDSFENLGGVTVNKLFGRMTLVAKDPALTWDVIREHLTRIFGIAHFGRAHMVDATFENLCKMALEVLPEGDFSFGVRTKKADERWRMSKTETSRELGAVIVQNRSWRVDLENPDLWVRVEVANGKVLLSTERVRGRRGLPVGSSGHVLALLSGGIDSPVACHTMMSRGCRISGVHFHSAPYTTRQSQDKVLEIAAQLQLYQPRFNLFMVPFAELQQEIVKKAPQEYRILLYRRFMVRVAQKLAHRIKAKALVTGESLGQVASQTLANMRSVQAASHQLILRPLVGLDKEEIISRAQAAGTFEISIQPHDDCCTYLMPRQPATASKIPELDEAESNLAIDDLVFATLNKVEKHVFGEK